MPASIDFLLRFLTDGRQGVRETSRIQRNLAGARREADFLQRSLRRLGGFLTVSAVVNQARATGDWAQTIEQLSLETGIATEKLAAWDAVALKTGTNLQVFNDAFRQLRTNFRAFQAQREIQQAEDERLRAQGIEPPRRQPLIFQKFLEDFGFNVDQFARLNDLQRFEAVMNRFEGVSDAEAQRLGASFTRIVGEFGTRIIPAARGGIGRMEEEARRQGLVPSEFEIKQLAEARREWLIAFKQLGLLIGKLGLAAQKTLEAAGLSIAGAGQLGLGAANIGLGALVPGRAGQALSARGRADVSAALRVGEWIAELKTQRNILLGIQKEQRETKQAVEDVLQ